jgi:hypothetical protein
MKNKIEVWVYAKILISQDGSYGLPPSPGHKGGVLPLGPARFKCSIVNFKIALGKCDIAAMVN